jgi:hypothetical protein
MLESIESKSEPLLPGWRSVVSAWVFVLLLVLLLAGTQAVASRRNTAPSQAPLTGAVIPRHDPASAGVGVPCATPLDECGKSTAALVPGMPYPYPLW